MIKSLLTVFTIVIFSIKVQSQVMVKLYVKDSIENMPLSYINGELRLNSDSLVVLFSKSDTTGKMSFINVTAGIYKLKISGVGFQTASRNIKVESKDLDLHDVSLLPTSMLKEVVIHAEPILIKKDTVEYDAGSFKVRQGAKTEDLLKKLPGLSINRDGEILFRGKVIESVLVNGEMFFGNDVRKAIQIIPYELLKKVQLYEAKTEEARNTGLETGEKIPTLNLVTKKFSKTTYFGDVQGGTSIGKRHNLAFNANTLGKGLNYNLFGQDNNANLTGSSNSKIPNRIIPGINENKFIGLNISYSKSPKITMSGSLQYNPSKTNIDQKDYSRNLLYENRIQTNATVSNNTANSKTMQFNYSLNARIDTLTNITLQTTGNIIKNLTTRSSTTIINLDETLLNHLNSNLTNAFQSSTGHISIFANHRFNKRGRSVSFGINIDHTSSKQNDSLETSTLIRNEIENNQKIVSNKTSNRFGFNLFYNEPIHKHGSLQLGYSYSTSPGSNERSVFNLSNVRNTANDSLNNYIQSNLYEGQTITPTYNFNNKSVEIVLASNFEYNKLSSLQADSSTKRKYFTVNPSLRFKYKWSDSKSVNLNYRGNLIPPGKEMLQPIIDKSNPLFIKLGNTQLRPSFSHSLNYSYSSFNLSGQSLDVNITALILSNQIQESISFDSDGLQTSRLINFNGNYSAIAEIVRSFSKNDIDFSLGTKLSYSKDGRPVNGIVNYNKSIVVNGQISISKEFSNDIEVSFQTSPGLVKSNNTFSSIKSNNFTNSISLEAQWSNDDWFFSMDLSNRYIGKLNENKAQSFNIINLFVEKKILKTYPLYANLTGFNIINQKAGLVRTITQNIQQELWQNTIPAYLMFGLKWSFIRKPDH